MRSFVPIAIIYVLSCVTAVFAEESAVDFEARGIAALKRSQEEPDAVVSAAIFFGKAAAAYDQARNDAKTVEMNSFLYWCKKKMTLQQINTFVRGGEATALALAKRMEEVEKAASANDAKSYFERADAYSKAHPGEYLLIAIRFFEVAERFKGTDESLAAQDRSLAAMQVAFKELESRKVPSTNSPTQAAPLPPQTTESQARQRLPVPPAPRQSQVEGAIKELYKTEYSHVKPDEKKSLAETLRKSALEATDPTEKYVQLRESKELFFQAREVDASIKAVNDLGAAFATDLPAEKATLLQRFLDVSRTQEANRSLASAALEAISEAIAADRYELLNQLTTLAEKSTARSEDKALIAETKERVAFAAQAMREWNIAKNAMEKLKSNPEDSATNVLVGKFYCFVKDDWEHGLPLLAKGNDFPLKSAATTELKKPTDAMELHALGNSWWELAEKQPAATKRGIMAHAAKIYRSALPGLSGITKALTEKRLAAMVPPSLEKDLLVLLDTVRDAVAGKCEMTGNTLTINGGVKLQLPYYPADEYDFSVSFTKVSGKNSFNILFPKAGRPCELVLGGWGNKISGMQIISGQYGDGNATRRELPLVVGRKYDILLKVRTDSVSVLLDGNLLVEHKSDGSDFSLKQEWGLPDIKAIGIESGNPGLVHYCRIKDVKGSGKVIDHFKK